jgi:hypothetical protein
LAKNLNGNFRGKPDAGTQTTSALASHIVEQLAKIEGTTSDDPVVSVYQGWEILQGHLITLVQQYETSDLNACWFI